MAIRLARRLDGGHAQMAEAELAGSVHRRDHGWCFGVAIGADGQWQ
eukprot:ctg_7214.g674